MMAGYSMSSMSRDRLSRNQKEAAAGDANAAQSNSPLLNLVRLNIKSEERSSKTSSHESSASVPAVKRIASSDSEHSSHQQSWVPDLANVDTLELTFEKSASFDSEENIDQRLHLLQ
jgi:hypothetical protein